MAKYEVYLVNQHYYSSIIEAEDREEAEEKAEELLSELGTSIMAYDGESWVDEIEEIKE